jgi:type IV pilus assembly protein PilM
MRFLSSLFGMLSDPPPMMAFELSDAGIAAARFRPEVSLDFHPLKPDVISASPMRDNILDPDALAAAVKAIAPANGNRKRRDVALILPDYCARISVLDFDGFPSDKKEQLSLIRFRVRKSVPFDVESAAIGYWPQALGNKKFDVVVALAPWEITSRYEAPFRKAGWNPGLVTLSSLAALNLVRGNQITVVAKLNGCIFTILVLEKGVLKLVRCLDLPAATLEDVGVDLFPTFVYVEDQLGAKAEKLLLCGFGEMMEDAERQYQAELGIEVEAVRSSFGLAGSANAGLMGYVQGQEG